MMPNTTCGPSQGLRRHEFIALGVTHTSRYDALPECAGSGCSLRVLSKQTPHATDQQASTPVNGHDGRAVFVVEWVSLVHFERAREIAAMSVEQCYKTNDSLA